ncbi:hypothetical protein [Streptomyces hokutonensis]|uniref:hypothetical protein n=1 Tax=Streptomyces hokutonensis TaxID=1306990 RepID=UPI0037FDB037
MTLPTAPSADSSAVDTQAKSFPRLNVNINDDTVAALQRLKSEKGLSATEITRRAIALFDLVERETNKLDKPGKLQIVDHDGTVRELLLLT